MRNIWLIRHGATEANEKKLYYGSTDISLTASGRQELAELKKRGGYPDISGADVYTSGMKRANETLELLYPGAVPKFERALGEMDFGRFEMRAYEELQYDSEYQQWLTGNYLENVCPGGESAVLHVRRAFAGFERVLDATLGNVLIVCHGGTITGIMEKLFPDVGENRWYWSCDNGCGYTVTFDGKIPVDYAKIPEE